MKNTLLLSPPLAALALAIACPAQAGATGPAPVTTITKQSRKDNKIFVGVNGGVRVPYAYVGTDYLFGKGWQPYVGVDTLKRVKAHEETSTTSCPSGFDLSKGACVATD